MLKTKLVTAALASVLAALAAVPSAQAATDYFMKVEPVSGDQSIKGETLDKDFAGAIQISNFSWGAENAINIGSATTGAGAGKAQFNELTVEKPVDSTTPLFFQRLTTGRHLQSLEIITRKAGGAPATSSVPTRYLFQMVFVKSQKQSGDSADDAPRETLTFAYGAVAQQATRQTPTGAPATNVFANWSQVTNTLIKEPLPVPYR
jgi:type VI secretion system secreted protein Hcp